jgi:hypothetical protein
MQTDIKSTVSNLSRYVIHSRDAHVEEMWTRQPGVVWGTRGVELRERFRQNARALTCWAELGLCLLNYCMKSMRIQGSVDLQGSGVHVRPLCMSR